MITWKALENNVRTLAQFKWNCTAVKETINGVNFDCVLKPKPNNWIIVEITENETLDKVRTDISKCASTRFNLFSQNIFPEFYLVMPNEPSNSMQTTGQGDFVSVLSYDSFSNLFFDFNSYAHIRSKKIFGSAVNPFTGEPDNVEYTPVYYEQISPIKSSIQIKDISKYLKDGKRIILLGNYGTGKSRCLKEMFFQLSFHQGNNIYYPIAINLKENWGTKRAEEIIRRHFEDLGLTKEADSILKILGGDKLILLLDGFDEIGAQIWSDDNIRLKQIRASSLSGVKELISKTKSPLIISGREHYFNNNYEMLTALGLNLTNTIIIRSKDEFSDEEMGNYLKSLSIFAELPFWLPKRPLICQIINSIDKAKLESFFIDSENAVEFWDTLIINLCEREARIRSVLNPETILKILIQIAQFTRSKINDIGPLTISEINKAFELVVGTPPVDESAVMLQRLPSLGRISSDSNDRQFIDYYILDGLRALNLIDIVNDNDLEILNEHWDNPLHRLGMEIVSNKISTSHTATFYLEFLKKAANSNNKILAGDLLSVLTLCCCNSNIDIGGMIIECTYIYTLNLSNSLIDNFCIKDSFIDNLDVSHCSFSKITFKDCEIKNLYGVSSKKDLPSFIISGNVENYFPDSMNSMDKKQNLNSAHLIFISLIKKLFLFSGVGKIESELLKSFGNKNNKAIANEIFKILIKERIITRTKDNGNSIITPKTFNRNRMVTILNELNHSKDPIWLEIEKIKSN
ncbi:MAG: hypothetical protein Q7U54_03035 [Bacteroidales bacterium]|nr:hypothetical protein [Bacteroidales bacterium]